MANTVIAMETNIDLIEKYKSLMEASADGDSLYIRAREVVNALKTDNLLTSEDEGAMIAQVVAQLSGSISGQAMGTALDWGHREKQLVLQKEELEYKIDMMKIEKEKMEFDRDTSEANKHYTQAKIIREMGTPTIVDGDVVSLNDSGKFYREERILEKDLDIKTNQNIQVQSQTKEVQARIHKLVADTYVNHGMFTGYVIADGGITGTYANFFNGNGITLSSNGLLVGNKNLSDYRYIIDSPINSIDTTYLSNGSYKQIVNSVSSNDSTFTITTNNGVEVYYGSKKVIDSKVLIKSYIVQSVSTFTKGELTNGTHYICSSPNLNCILLLSMRIDGSNSYISKYFDMSKPDYEELFAFTLYGIDPGTSMGSENYYYWKKVGTNLYLKYVQKRYEPWNIPASSYTLTILDT